MNKVLFLAIDRVLNNGEWAEEMDRKGIGLSQNLCKRQRSNEKRQSVRSERAAEPSDVRLIIS